MRVTNHHSPVRLAFALAHFSMLTHCGTRVDAGDNAKKPPAVAGDDATTPQPTEGARPTPADGTGSPTPAPGAGSSPDTAEAPLSCFGPSPEQVPPLDVFCAKISVADQTSHAATFAAICTDKTAVNLFRDGCGWDGGGDKRRFYRIIHKTNVDDAAATSFDFASRYSEVISQDMKTAVSRLKLAYADPTSYASKYKMPTNTRLFDPKVEGDTIYYSVESNTAVSVSSFRGKIRELVVSPELTVFFDEAVADFKTVKMHRQVTFFVSAGAEKLRVVTFNEKNIEDGGLHQVALKTLVDVDLDRMGVIVENAKIP